MLKQISCKYPVEQPIMRNITFADQLKNVVMTIPQQFHLLNNHKSYSPSRKRKQDERFSERTTMDMMTTSSSKKVKVITSSFTDECTPKSTSPLEFVRSLLHNQGLTAEVRDSSTMHNFFLPMTQANIDAYGEDMIRAIRKSDIDSLRTMKNNGRLLQCCNRFGESTIHMACRRSTVDVVSFLIKEGKVSIRVCDDYGRTPLHDAFWNAQPNFELMDLLLDEEPELLFVSDKRGHTPLDYSRKEHRDLWINYLSKRIQNKSHVN